MFEKELIIYNQQKTALLASNPTGGFVVIKGDEVLGVWQTRIDALKAGIEKYGNVVFLIKNITENDTTINFSRNLTFA